MADCVLEIQDAVFPANMLLDRLSKTKQKKTLFVVYLAKGEKKVFNTFEELQDYTLKNNSNFVVNLEIEKII